MFFFTLSFAVPTAVLLSQWTGVDGCTFPLSSKIRRKSLPSFKFKKRPPNSVSAAGHTTILIFLWRQTCFRLPLCFLLSLGCTWRKNILPVCFLIWIQTSKTHLRVCLVPCQVHGILFLYLGGLLGNLVDVQLDCLSIAARGCSSTRLVGDQFSFRDQFWKGLIKLQTGHQSKKWLQVKH